MSEGIPRRRGWMLEEQRSIGRENADPVHVGLYDQKEDANAADEARYLRAQGMTPDTTVIDLGCGTGQFALAAAPMVRRVIAVDPSAVMRSLLQEKVERASAAIEVIEGGFLTYEHR